MVTSRFRTELTDVAWGYESSYGTIPPRSEMAITAGSGMGRYFRQWGLVAGGITLPNPRYEFQQYMGIGVDSRNMLFPIRGPQTMEGTVSGVMLCHNSSRYMLEVGLGVAFNRHNLAAHATTFNSGAASATITTTYNKVGNAETSAPADIDAYVAATNIENGADGVVATGQSIPRNIIIIAPYPGATLNIARDTWAYIGVEDGSSNTFYVWKDRDLSVPGWNGKKPVGGASTEYGIYNIERAALTTGQPIVNDTTASNNPLNSGEDAQFRFIDKNNNAAGGNRVFIREALTQHSFTLAAKFNADDGSSFSTTYFGNKVGSLAFAFSEGEPVTYTTSFVGKDMRHNIGQEDGVTSTRAAEAVMKYADKYTEANWDTVAKTRPTTQTLEPAPVADTRVLEQPYFFSEATLTLRGVSFARFRSFNISIDNGLDPRYYIRQNDEGTSGANRQVISEILEGRRNISFSGSLDVDATSDNTLADGNPVDAQLLQYVLNQGGDFANSTSGADMRDDPVMTGIGIQISLERTTDASDGSNGVDRMVFSLPAGGGDPTTSTPGLIMRSASMDIAGPPQIHQAMDIDGFASSISIELYDNTAPV